LNRPGCIDIQKTELIISIPEITVNGEVFHIMKGSSVQLEASGGEQYSWSPTTGLSGSNISNPVATPITTTEYQVTVSDSIGCTVSKKILVKVEQTAFIPTLFTPNQDGNNDYLKVYGLTQANGFALKIYNREGNMVFETTDPASNGWDGTKSGAEQPSGVYYWKIEGTYSSGSKLLLNGKSSGSVVLMR
jgi:gliding motility-associated-like protein